MKRNITEEKEEEEEEKGKMTEPIEEELPPVIGNEGRGAFRREECGDEVTDMTHKGI